MLHFRVVSPAFNSTEQCTRQVFSQPFQLLASDRVLDRGSFDFNSAPQPSSTLRAVPTRLSLAPQNLYSQQESEPRVLTIADNHFRFAQNLRQGLPVNRAPPSLTTVIQSNNQQQAQSPLTQLANNILLQRPMPLAGPEQASGYKGQNISRLSQLQPRRQEHTPPFNLSE
jgi:ATP-dependent DNA helicase HFM1/MER3